MTRDLGMRLIKRLQEPGVLFISNDISNDILDYGEFKAAITENVSSFISEKYPYSLAVIFGDVNTHLAIIKKKMSLSGGGVAVASYETCDVTHWPFDSITMYKNTKNNIIIENNKNFEETLEIIYNNEINKECIINLLKKYNNLTSPTFESKGNELFYEDAEKMSTCIFTDTRDKITTPIFQISEDDLIYKDLYSAGNGSLIEDFGGHVRYITETGRNLDIIYVNRKEGEAALGVDLIYYTREYRSIVMLQYKRISGGVYYTSSDRNYAKEIERMEKTRKYFEIPNELESNIAHRYFRLSDCPYYLKLCPESSTTTNRFVSGACINLDHWNLLMLSERCSTPHGNNKLSYEDLDGRHLRSTEFIILTQRGLLGGYMPSIKRLGGLIRNLKSEMHIVIASIESPSSNYSDT